MHIIGVSLTMEVVLGSSLCKLFGLVLLGFLVRNLLCFALLCARDLVCWLLVSCCFFVEGGVMDSG